MLVLNSRRLVNMLAALALLLATAWPSTGIGNGMPMNGMGEMVTASSMGCNDCAAMVDKGGNVSCSQTTCANLAILVELEAVYTAAGVTFSMHAEVLPEILATAPPTPPI